MTKHKYRALEIISGDCNCPLSKHAGKRVLFADAELLIKTTHFYSGCSCQIKHYSDRRHQRDRRQFDIQSLGANPYRRKQPFGRRTTDIATKLKLEKSFQQCNSSALASLLSNCVE